MVAGAALIGLLLAGLPLMTFMGGGAEGDESHGDDGVDGADDAPASGEVHEDADVPVDYEFVFRATEETIDRFRPGTDTLTITSDSWDLCLWVFDDTEGGATLQIDRAGENAILRFAGLSEVPLADIHLKVVAPGAAPVVLPLSDAAEPETVLQPTAPDAPEDAPPDPVAEPPLAPTDPDTPDTQPDPADPSEPLRPTDPDAPEA
jgi:hypothetical protein